MTHNNKKATTVIESFLAANPNPTAKQWKELTLIHPEYAADIAEISVLYIGEDEEVPFDQDLFNTTRSLMLNAVHANTAPISEAREALKKCRGVAVRAYAREIGLGEHIELFDQMVNGEVLVPYVVIKRLAARLNVQLTALKEVFAIRFQSQPIQAFQADGKPKRIVQPVTWEEAIKAAGIGGEEKMRLLRLELESE